MKIEIELPDQFPQEAYLTIDGRKLTVEMDGCCTTLKGIKYPETENTLGGIIASNLFSKVREICKAAEQAQRATWKKLPKKLADRIASDFF